MKNLKILAVFIFTVMLSAFSIGDAEANENEGEVTCHSASQNAPNFDYYDCGDCKKVDGRKGYAATLTCTTE